MGSRLTPTLSPGTKKVAFERYVERFPESDPDELSNVQRSTLYFQAAPPP